MRQKFKNWNYKFLRWCFLLSSFTGLMRFESENTLWGPGTLILYFSDTKQSVFERFRYSEFIYRPPPAQENRQTEIERQIRM